ncbi:hypothetical protein JJV70_20595 [Streptomyces sp. JJ66]|uniref:hypothetical protein n=1 Tax=Streptomyces sp. JJ66 TaxID=2803843 RepID=UPI001C5981DC|nr:hypothetical protein [Streptomyces sp. JJ66]MBW1604458.1 hypothetical protein [Streptomyces sp. JJ66]
MAPKGALWQGYRPVPEHREARCSRENRRLDSETTGMIVREAARNATDAEGRSARKGFAVPATITVTPGNPH